MKRGRGRGRPPMAKYKVGEVVKGQKILMRDGGHRATVKCLTCDRIRVHANIHEPTIGCRYCGQRKRRAA